MYPATAVAVAVWQMKVKMEDGSTMPTRETNDNDQPRPVFLQRHMGKCIWQ
jgi:hypothetical protein